MTISKKSYIVNVVIMKNRDKRGDRVFPNLEAEMARSKITQAKLAEMLGVTPTTLSFKLSGKSTLSLKECVMIKKNAFPDKTLDYLFQTEPEEEVV